IVCSEGLSSRQSQAKRGLAAWTIIMGGGPEGGETRRGGHTSYYATNPRSVGGVGEKSRKKSSWEAKCRKNRPLLGERLPNQGRDSRIRKHLRTEQPPPRGPAGAVPVVGPEISWTRAAPSPRPARTLSAERLRSGTGRGCDRAGRRRPL